MDGRLTGDGDDGQMAGRGDGSGGGGIEERRTQRRWVGDGDGDGDDDDDDGRMTHDSDDSICAIIINFSKSPEPALWPESGQSSFSMVSVLGYLVIHHSELAYLNTECG